MSEELADADLVVLPGSRATVADLAGLRSTRVADAAARRAPEGTPVLGISRGHRMPAPPAPTRWSPGSGFSPR